MLLLCIFFFSIFIQYVLAGTELGISVTDDNYDCDYSRCDILSAFASACAAAVSGPINLTISSETDHPIRFSGTDATNLNCVGAQYRFVVEFQTPIEFENDAVLNNFEFVGDNSSDIVFYGATTFKNLVIRDSKIKIAKSNSPTIFTDVSISSSRIRVSYPSFVPYRVYLYDDTTFVVVGTLNMLADTLIQAA
ncbi:hypothetical protein ADUPG1_010402, partial [Aduncisulcus paluster]